MYKSEPEMVVTAPGYFAVLWNSFDCQDMLAKRFLDASPSPRPVITLTKTDGPDQQTAESLSTTLAAIITGAGPDKCQWHAAPLFFAQMGSLERHSGVRFTNFQALPVGCPANAIEP